MPVGGFRCSCCGKWHDELPLNFAFDHPDYWQLKFEGKPGYFKN